MDQLGFIREKLDIKILILFILRRLSGAVDETTLLELVQCDGAIGYFDYTDCLSELLVSEHITENEDGYAITEKGARNADAVESSLPYSVRSRAMKKLAPVEERLRRMASIVARHTVGEDGCMVELAVEDGKGELMHLHLLCSGEEQAKDIEKRFRKNAEDYYQKLIELLTET